MRFAPDAGGGAASGCNPNRRCGGATLFLAEDHLAVFARHVLDDIEHLFERIRTLVVERIALVAVTAGGFCGLFGYGSTIVSGWGLGMLVQYTDWSIALYTLVGMALVGTAIFAAAWKAKPNGYDD